ncbi:hypothetical protein [Clostridium sp.]|uniref:hypothetical protein n=1 Tax=Clostridium sp. TaxID=1506 RepID=UPI002FC7C8F2
MDNKKLKLIIGLSLISVVLFLGLYSLSDVKYSSNEGLSYDEKKRDAKYLMDFLEYSYPYLEDIKEKNGQDILRNKNKIINVLSKTSSDEEFFKSISILFRSLAPMSPSINITGEPFNYGFTYLDKDLGLNASTYRDRFLEAKIKWEPIQQKYWETSGFAYINMNIHTQYINGDYYITGSQTPDAHIGDKVIDIDRVPVDEYVKNLPYDKFYKDYDYNYEKYFTYTLFLLDEKISSREITIENSSGEQKKIEVLPYDINKPLLEDGFKAYNADGNFALKEQEIRKSIKFLNFLDDEKILVLNFSAFNDLYVQGNPNEKKENLFSLIDNSEYLVLDLRNGFDNGFFYNTLDYIAPKEVDYTDYTIIKKNKVNDEFALSYSNSLTSFSSELISPLESFEKRYPLSDYRVYKEKRVKINGMNKYKGKVFVLYDNTFATEYATETLKLIIDNNICTVIAPNKFNLKENHYPLPTYFMLPNSNLPIQIKTTRRVDESGISFDKQVVTPQVIIKENTSKIIESLKRGEGSNIVLGNDELYTNSDEYFTEVLKLIK